MSRVNIVKRIKIDGRWKMFSIPRNAKGNYDWNAIADGRYYVEWYVGGTRRREGAGVTAAQALEAQRRKRHELEGRNLGVPGFEKAGETVKKPALRVAVKTYLEQIEALKKPNTHRKYEAVLERFLDFFHDRASIDVISADDLTRFVVTLKRDHGLGSNTILHNAVIIAQFLKRQGRSGITRELELPERITPLVKVYRHEELARFFAACSDLERALFATFLLTGFREQEVMFLYWSDVNFELRTVRATAKPELGFYPKRWEDREVPAPTELMDELRKHTHRPNCQLVFPSPTGNREQHMLDHCKSIATRAKLDPTKFDLKTFRSTYATGMLRRGFDVRTVQHWMGHKSLETTMRYLAPATDVHDEVDLVTIPSVGKADPAPRKSAARESRTSRRSPVIEQVADRPGPKKQSNISNKEENSMAERSVNKAILVGRLGADAETRFTQNGTPVSRVSLAMNRQWTDSDKQVHEETDWMSIVIWNMENLAAYLTKGSKLYVEGRLQTRSYDDKDGVKRYVTEVVAQNLVLLGGNGHSNGNGNGRGAREQSERRPSPDKPSNRHRHQEPEPEEQGVQDDDIPF